MGMTLSVSNTQLSHTPGWCLTTWTLRQSFSNEHTALHKTNESNSPLSSLQILPSSSLLAPPNLQYSTHSLLVVDLLPSTYYWLRYFSASTLGFSSRWARSWVIASSRYTITKFLAASSKLWFWKQPNNQKEWKYTNVNTQCMETNVINIIHTHTQIMTPTHTHTHHWKH